MSFTFTLQGNSSVLTSDFSPALELNSAYTYGLALIGLHTYNTIPNIEDDTYFVYEDNHKKKQIKIPTGTYEIADIENYLKKRLIEDENIRDDDFFLKANNNTLKCEIYHRKCPILFQESPALAQLLGFSQEKLKPGIVHSSNLPVEIVSVRTIHISTNITEGAFHNGKQSHSIYEFAVAVDPGFAIDEAPKNLIYLPVNKASISNITLTVRDQDFRLVNFRGENLRIILELKRWS